MQLSELINPDLKSLSDEDKVEKCLGYMQEFNVHHLPVLHGDSLLGLISYDEVRDMDKDKTLSECNPEMINATVYANKHIFDAINLAGEMNVTLVSILDDQDNYLGALSVNDMLSSLSNISSMKEPGGIIVLNVAKNNYTMSEISQIIEGNDAKILSSYITSSPEEFEFEITLKVNKTDIDGILQTFERYDYNVTHSFQETLFQEELKNKYEELIHYLNM